jgi:hypothetical protein
MRVIGRLRRRRFMSARGQELKRGKAKHIESKVLLARSEFKKFKYCRESVIVVVKGKTKKCKMSK